MNIQLEASVYAHYFQFFCMEHLPVFPYFLIYVILYLYQRGLMDIYFILQIIKQLWITNKDCCVYFAALNVLVLVTGNHFIWLLHPLDTPLSTVHFVSVLVCFWETPYFLVLIDAASSFFISPVTVLKSSIYPRSSASLSGSGLGNHHPKAICTGSCSGAVASFLAQLT